MKKYYQFKTGERVQMFDEDEEKIVFGRVKSFSPETLVVKWDDLREEVTHLEDEFSLIQPSFA